MNIVGLFAGIGGVEEGFRRAGHRIRLLAEIDAAARAVLEVHFPEAEIAGDVRSITDLPPDSDVLVAGFPCQDLSLAGRKEGICGPQSGLVSHVFRLLERRRVPWVVLENVPFMLTLEHGRAVGVLTSELGRLGYDWAYRVVDTRAFGLPQRRRRVYLVASRGGNPRDVLLADEARRLWPDDRYDGDADAFGFYWTEGYRGLGWTRDAVPPLKKGSTLGLGSAPAIWLTRTGAFGTPQIEDAERLQGFSPGWTRPAVDCAEGSRARWRLVGNAVSVPVAAWLGRRLAAPGCFDGRAHAMEPGRPSEQRGSSGHRCGDRDQPSGVGPWPVAAPPVPLATFLSRSPEPLSRRATLGFRCRLLKGRLRVPPAFVEALAIHAGRMPEAASARSKR